MAPWGASRRRRPGNRGVPPAALGAQASPPSTRARCPRSQPKLRISPWRAGVAGADRPGFHRRLRSAVLIRYALSHSVSVGGRLPGRATIRRAEGKMQITWLELPSNRNRSWARYGSRPWVSRAIHGNTLRLVHRGRRYGPPAAPCHRDHRPRLGQREGDQQGSGSDMASSSSA